MAMANADILNWRKPRPELDQLEAMLRSRPEPELEVLRVNQLDAGVLDRELHWLLKLQLGRACSLLPPGFLEHFKPEVDAMFNLLLFRFTVWLNRPTPGMHLQGLRYRDESVHRRFGAQILSGGIGKAGGAAAALSAPLLPPDDPTKTQRLLHGLLSVGVQWGFARLRRHGLVHGWGAAERGSFQRLAWGIMRRLEILFRMAWLINLLLFLRLGKYATPVDRLLQMRMVHASADPTPRPINYHFLNRQLLWDHWAKMTVVLAPLVDWAALGRAVSSATGRLRRRGRALGQALGVGLWQEPGQGGGAGRGGLVGGEGTGGAGGVETLLPCSDCGAFPPTMPYLSTCGHMFCYHCLRSACSVDSRYSCPTCGDRFSSSKRWSGPRSPGLRIG
ncbi:unnamed protein product [Discosporangium mesarthrocarpum]